METPMVRLRKPLLIAGSLVVCILIGLRLALPAIVKRYVNDALDEIPGYSGHVSDIDIHLWRGAYTIKEASLVKTGGKVPVPFFYCARTVLSIEWRALFKGSLVGKIEFTKPALNFVAAPDEARAQTGVDRRWQDSVRALFPLRFDRVLIHEGTLRFRNFNSDPKVNVSIDDIELTASNLTNSNKVSKSLVAHLEGAGRAENHAPVSLNLDWDPFQREPHFNLDAQVKMLDLTKLNDFIKAYGGFDVEKGRFSLYTELASSGKTFQGYTKPVFDDVHAFSLKKDADQNPLRLAWEGTVSLVLELFKDHGHDQARIATKIPFKGSYDEPEPELWRAITGLLSNAFIHSLKAGLDDSVSMKSVATKQDDK